ncbi:MAG: glycerol-3-phosphate 1-O-acyltransferase PlsY [Prevotellaceae bacterium]|nr:glycerol-3-phosphate 1-O-acyltransferase PlsY [Prevotellaceae bacterium]
MIETILMYAGLSIAAYLLGSVSNAVWVGNLLYRTDVRKHGSKNAGSTNVLRVLGWKAALPVFILDMAKGAAAVCLVFLTGLQPETNTFVGFQIVLGMAAMLGHIFPVFAGFKGGKGVATVAGVMTAIHPSAMAMTFGVFVLTLLISHFVSLSSIIAALCFPFIVIVVFGNWLNVEETLTLKLFSIVVMVIILITHRNNMKRLWRHEESKIVFRKRPSITIPEK